jgi:hypothetical protein
MIYDYILATFNTKDDIIEAIPTSLERLKIDEITAQDFLADSDNGEISILVNADKKTIDGYMILSYHNEANTILLSEQVLQNYLIKLL